MTEEYYINLLKEKVNDKSLSLKEKAYFERILRVYNMPDLTNAS
jgi:hypothetical protein